MLKYKIIYYSICCGCGISELKHFILVHEGVHTVHILYVYCTLTG
jgi:hypothetical protein